MWVSVEDRLPGEPLDFFPPDVLVFNGETMHIAIYARPYQVQIEEGGQYVEETGINYLPSGWWLYEENSDVYIFLENVTHWMPLPEAPGGAI